jgi:hypothetical protein
MFDKLIARLARLLHTNAVFADEFRRADMVAEIDRLKLLVEANKNDAYPMSELAKARVAEYESKINNLVFDIACLPDHFDEFTITR